MSSWPTVPLRDLACPGRKWALNGGPFGSKLTTRDYVASGVPVVRGTNIAGPGKFSHEGFVFVSEEKADELRANNAHPGDLVFTQRGTLGQVGLIPETAPFRRYVISQSQMKLTVDPARLSALFAYYCFSHPATVRSIENHAMAAGVPHINLEILRNFEIPLPPLAVQRHIAAILSAYDDLIENCERRIRVLDDMARGLYREWFLNFRYPAHEKVPLVDSPLGRVPTGWGVVSVDALKGSGRYAVNGGPFGSKLGVKDYLPDGVPVIRGSNLTESGRFRGGDFVFVSAEKARELSANLARPGDIVVTQRGTLGQVGMIPVRAKYNTFVISQSQMKITLDEDKVDRTYAFFALSSAEATQRIKNLASSSGVPHINLAVLREFLILSPPLPLQRRFAELARHTEDLIESTNEQAGVLRRTRDLLLPRLLSGRLAVEDAA